VTPALGADGMTVDHVNVTVDHVYMIADHVSATVDHVYMIADHVNVAVDRVYMIADHIKVTVDHVYVIVRPVGVIENRHKGGSDVIPGSRPRSSAPSRTIC
jgi:hypothetical protein